MRKDLWSYYQSLGSKFRYALGKVLGTQDRPTLKLASHHCVLCLNPIKNHLNTCILDSHTHTNMSSITLNNHTYPSTQTKESQTKETLIIHRTYKKPYLKQNMAASISSNKTYQTQKVNILETLTIHLRKPNTNAWAFLMHDLPFYLPLSNMWMDGIKMKKP